MADLAEQIESYVDRHIEDATEAALKKAGYWPLENVSLDDWFVIATNVVTGRGATMTALQDHARAWAANRIPDKGDFER